MAADEAVLIKGYDSEEDGRARFTLHTTFDDPTTTADAEPRESNYPRLQSLKFKKGCLHKPHSSDVASFSFHNGTLAHQEFIIAKSTQTSQQWVPFNETFTGGQFQIVARQAAEQV